MERAELEKLMDAYKAQALEYGGKNAEVCADNRNEKAAPPAAVEKRTPETIEKRQPYRRDRRDPLPRKTGAEPENKAEKTEPAEAAEAFAQAGGKDVPNGEGSTDVSQYLKEIFEKADADPDASEGGRKRYEDIEQFLEYNKELGTVRVEAFAGDRAFGISSARVMIFLPLESGNVSVFDGLTDVNGSTKNVLLPAPPRKLSLAPQNTDSKRAPYSVYNIYVEHPLYVGAAFTNVPVFSGVESIQPVRMLVKSVGSQEPETIVVDQSAQNQL